MARKNRRLVNNLTKSPSVRPNTEPTMIELKPLQITAAAAEADKTSIINPIPPIQIIINEATSNMPQPSISEGPSSGQSVKSLKRTHCSVKKARRTTRKNNISEETFDASKENVKDCCIICPLRVLIFKRICQ